MTDTKISKCDSCGREISWEDTKLKDNPHVKINKKLNFINWLSHAIVTCNFCDKPINRSDMFKCEECGKSDETVGQTEVIENEEVVKKVLCSVCEKKFHGM